MYITPMEELDPGAGHGLPGGDSKSSRRCSKVFETARRWSKVVEGVRRCAKVFDGNECVSRRRGHRVVVLLIR